MAEIAVIDTDLFLPTTPPASRNLYVGPAPFQSGYTSALRILIKGRLCFFYTFAGARAAVGCWVRSCCSFVAAVPVPAMVSWIRKPAG